MPSPSQPDATDQDLERLFAEASDLAPQARRAWLTELRHGRPEVANELEALLAAVEERPDFLASALEVDASSFAAEGLELSDFLPGDLSGTLQGGFRLLRRIGSGGSSEVYEAEQQRPQRRVALKIVPELGRGGPAVRFEGEAQALARMDHPAVARVFGAGRGEQGRWRFSWMAVEFIPEPQSITEHAQSRALSLEARVRLFLPVCDAVHHAHRRGVLHRDVKPANLLVSTDGRVGPKVIDFGLARLSDAVEAPEHERTRTGELLGTLRYMSPEQCAGDPELVETRSDVYALGVVLFELLTGVLPYALDELPLLAVLETIRSEPARDAAPFGVDRDLSRVLAKALSKDPDERYESAAALHDDLARWLAHEPVRARPPSLVHRLRLFARRNPRRFVGTGAAMLLALVATVVIVSLFTENRAARNAARDARDRARTAQRSRDEARVDLGRLRAELKALVAGSDELGTATLEGSVQGELPVASAPVASALVARARDAERRAATPEAKRAAVADAVERLRLLASALESDPESVAPLAAAFLTVGDLHGVEWVSVPADVERSVPAYREGLRLWRRAAAAEPAGSSASADARRGVFDALTSLAEALRKVGRSEEGLGYVEEAVTLARADHARKATLERARRLFWALTVRGDLHIDTQPYEAGLADAREALVLSEEIARQRPDQARSFRDVAWSSLRAGIWVARLEDDREASAAHHQRGLEAMLRATQLSLEQGAPVHLVRDDLRLLFGAFLWNDVDASQGLATDEERARRLRLLFELRGPLEGSEVLLDALPALSWVGLWLAELTSDASEREALQAFVRQAYASLDASDRAEATGALRARFEGWSPLGDGAMALLRELEQGLPGR